MKRLMYETPFTEVISIYAEGNFVATGGIPDGKTGSSGINDLEEESGWDPIIWS